MMCNSTQDDLPLITAKYLLAISIPFRQDEQGEIWLDPLWHHDLVAHTDYIADLTVLAPGLFGTKIESSWVKWITPEKRKVRFIALPTARGRLEAARLFLRSCLTAWSAIGQAEIVHSGVVGWPLPVGLAVNPLTVLRRRKLFIMVESSFWRQTQSARNPLKHLESTLLEAFARWSLRHADLGIYTHQGYAKSLPIGPRAASAIIPASWIHAADVMEETAAHASWQGPMLEPGPTRFLLPSRLEASKGVDGCLAALRLLETAGTQVDVDVIGQGTLADEIAEFGRMARSVRLRLLEPVAYGAPFSSLLRSYDCILVPTVGDEQPRILYDAFAQARPVIATDTPGNRDILEGRDIGRLVPRNDPQSLAGAIADLSGHRVLLRDMGLRARHVAQEHTHAHMHATRAGILRHLLE